MDTRRAQIRKSIRQVFLEDWDPIGVCGVPEAEDEYDGYIDVTYYLLLARATEEEIMSSLYRIEKEWMQLHPDLERLRRAAKRLREIDLSL